MTTESVLRVVFCGVGSAPAVRIIPHGLASMQDLVGGFIEIVPIDGVKGVVLVVNEEAALHGLAPNFELPARAPIVRPGVVVLQRPADAPLPGEMGVHRLRGDCFLVGINEDVGEFAALSEERAVEMVELARSWRRWSEVR